MVVSASRGVSPVEPLAEAIAPLLSLLVDCLVSGLGGQEVQKDDNMGGRHGVRNHYPRGAGRVDWRSLVSFWLWDLVIHAQVLRFVLPNNRGCGFPSSGGVLISFAWNQEKQHSSDAIMMEP